MNMTTLIDTVTQTTSEEIVIRFLQALEAQDHSQIVELLASDLRYTNVSLPTLKGGKVVSSLFKRLMGKRVGFQVQIHRIATNGSIVMTERTDVITIGSLHVGFWVCGTFRVEQGRIVLWRDYFDWMNITRGTLRGVLGIPVRKLRIALPVVIES
jgi:limonene-1,2-epoxide hydrolase